MDENQFILSRRPAFLSASSASRSHRFSRRGLAWLALSVVALLQCARGYVPNKGEKAGAGGVNAGSAGTASGEAGQGGSGDVGTGGEPDPTVYMMGVDISSTQEAVDNGAVYVDTDGATKDLLELFKNHGFNTVRLRTFVNPMAPYGYAGGACLKREAYCDRDHTLEFGRQIKAAGMRFLLDFHYSDTWADPGKQIIPEAWRDAESIAELADLMKAYTTDVVSTLVAGGARPDIVQIGNEITPGLLIHVPTASTDCYGNNASVNALNGSTAHWDNLATLLVAGIEGVKDVDENIQIMLHLENTETKSGVIDWINHAQARGVEFDVLGLSCYPAWQGPPEGWRDTFETVASTFPELKFAIAEYNPDRREANQIMLDLPNGRGLGTFLWEPTQSGVWGASLFTLTNGAYHANAADFADFDAMRVETGL